MRFLSKLFKFKIIARDGEIGHLADIYFNDESWQVLYLVDDMGKWFLGKKILISPKTITNINKSDNCVSVDLTIQEVKSCPGVETHRPVSMQQFEAGLGSSGGHRCCNLGAGAHYDLARAREDALAKKDHPIEAHLRSLKEVQKYHVNGIDGRIGDVEDFETDDDYKAILNIAIKNNSFSHHCGLLPVKKIVRIDYDKSCVFTKVNRSDVGFTISKV